MLDHLKNRILCWRYPFYKIYDTYDQFDPTVTRYDLFPEGWRKAFGKQFSKELKKILKKENLLYTFTITDIKEKYGTLRIYSATYTEAIDKLFDKYEILSIDYCINCGKPTIYQNGYYTLCEDCNLQSRGPSKALIDLYITIPYDKFKEGMQAEDLKALIELERPWQKVTVIRSVELLDDGVLIKYNRKVKRKYRC